MIPEEFKDMRPFEPEELSAAYDSLLADPMFRAVVGMVMPQIPSDMLGPMTVSYTHLTLPTMAVV